MPLRLARYAAVAAAVFAVAAVAGAASASTTVTNYSSTGEIAVTGDGADNRIWIKTFANRTKWRITDAAGLVESMTGDPTCVRGRDFHTLVCDRAARRPAKVQTAYGRGGDDRIALGRGVRSWDLSGDTGDDTLVGANLADRLNGGSGSDSLTGGYGVDRLYGAGGNDVLKARDGLADGLIMCDGAGGGSPGARDRAVADARDSAHPSCETVDVR